MKCLCYISKGKRTISQPLLGTYKLKILFLPLYDVILHCNAVQAHFV